MLKTLKTWRFELSGRWTSASQSITVNRTRNSIARYWQLLIATTNMCLNCWKMNSLKSLRTTKVSLKQLSKLRRDAWSSKRKFQRSSVMLTWSRTVRDYSAKAATNSTLQCFSNHITFCVRNSNLWDSLSLMTIVLMKLIMKSHSAWLKSSSLQE